MFKRTNPWIQFGAAALVGFLGSRYAHRKWKEHKRRDRKNPLPEDPEEAYTAFHWGNPPDAVAEVDVSPMPRDLVELGELQSVTYATRKGNEVADYFHDFGRRGKNKPTLAYDPKGRGLHIVGGAYTVEDRGIVD